MRFVTCCDHYVVHQFLPLFGILCTGFPYNFKPSHEGLSCRHSMIYILLSVTHGTKAVEFTLSIVMIIVTTKVAVRTMSTWNVLHFTIDCISGAKRKSFPSGSYKNSRNEMHYNCSHIPMVCLENTT